MTAVDPKPSCDIFGLTSRLRFCASAHPVLWSTGVPAAHRLAGQFAAKAVADTNFFGDDIGEGRAIVAGSGCARTRRKCGNLQHQASGKRGRVDGLLVEVQTPQAFRA
jgi:hypothetical protein